MSEPNPEKTIFAAARQLPPEDRAAYLDQACRENGPLRRRIEALLNASEQSGAFLEVSAAPTLRRTPAASIPLAEKPGDKVGRYKLLQQIGEGGCGVVYLAEQEEPVRRRVALKIIKLGMDTRNVISRFEAERQALAIMDHPNIAKVFDAGATETGRPYFVMELVRGMKITDYCDEAKLSIQARLNLFMQVCQAIQHAHQKGVIHRDIKPSNILVTINDGVAVPKVIDFGIAKATGGQQLTDKTIFTAFEQFIGTPAYMSPEQAVLTSLDIDTRSDIYALGVLLYEMLTSKTPFDSQELLAAGLDEMRRTIQEKEPARPSTRLSTLPDEELSTTAQRRGLDAPKLAGQLRGDLDWIVIKCLEKDRARRYETADGLAADIERHLRNEPVVACPPSNLYRLRKLIRRNKLAFAAVSVVVLSLLVGLIVSAIFFSREKAARVRADEQAAVAKAVTDFLRNDILRQADVDTQVAEGISMDTNLTVRQAVDRASRHLEGRFTNQPLVEASIQETLCDIYGNMGEPGTALRHAQRALELRQRILGSKDPLTLQAMLNVALYLEDSGDFDKEFSVAEEGLQLAKVVLGPEDPETINWMHRLGYACKELGKSDKAVPLFEEAVKIDTARFGPEGVGTLWGQIGLGSAYISAGRTGVAVPLLEKTLRLVKSKVGATNIMLWRYSICTLAVAYLSMGRPDDAIPLLEEELKAPQDPNHTASLSTRFNLATAYVETGRPEEAVSLLEPVLKTRRALLGSDHPDTAISMYELADAYLESGQLNEAVPLLEEAVAHYKAQPRNEDPLLRNSIIHLAVAYERTGRMMEAERLYNEVLTPVFLSRPDSTDVLNHRAEVLACQSKWCEAAADLSRLVAFKQDSGWVWYSLGLLLVQTGELDRYRGLCAKGLKRFGDTKDPYTAERTAIYCLLLPSSGADLQAVAKLADIAASSPTSHPSWPWFKFAKGLCEYRLGHYGDAVEWLQRWTPQSRDDLPRDVGTQAVLAMAQWRLKQSEAAHGALRKGLEIAQNKLPKLEGGGVGNNGWQHWIMAHELLREAKALIDESPPATVQTK